MKKKGFIFLMVSMMFLLAGCAEEIDLNEYVDVKFEGVSGSGTARYEIDYVDLISDHDEFFGFDDDDLLDGDGEEFLEDMEDAIEGDLSEDKNLTNGDEVIFTWDLSAKKIEDKYKVKFVYSDITETVKGLMELEPVDAFEGIEVTFDGPSGYATANFNLNNRKYDVFTYIFSDGTNLKNGDVVTITVAEGYMSYCTALGIMPRELTKSYTVEGLEELTTFDAFEGLKVTFVGNAPFGTVALDDRATKYDELDFRAIKSDELESSQRNGFVSNGDKVTVEIIDYSVERCIKKYNVIPETTTKTYVVSGLDTLIMESDEIPEETWTEIYEEWRTYLLENMTSDWESPEALKDVKYIGRAFGKTTADDMNTQRYSPIYVILFYEVTVEQPGQEPFQCYYTIKFENWKKTADGSYVYEKYSEPGKFSWLGAFGDTFTKDNLTYIGYETFNEAYETYIINDGYGYNTFGEFIDGYEYVSE